MDKKLKHKKMYIFHAVEKIYIVKMPTPSTAIYRFTAISIKTPMSIFHRIKKT